MIYILLVISIVVGVWIIRTVTSIAPWFPTRTADLDRVAEIAHLSHGETFAELGSGDGRVCLYLGRQYPHVQFVGYEMSVMLFVLSYVRRIFGRHRNVHFTWGDALQQDYTDTDVLYLFGTERSLNGSVMERIVPQMKSGARLISYNFTFHAWQGHVEKHASDGATMYTYTK